MGKNSAIQWTHHTFNPWHGCCRVSKGCERCYAERLSNRYRPGEFWGANASRRFFGCKHWQGPIAWNKAADNGEQVRVFCGSMCDVFEDPTHLGAHIATQLEHERYQLFNGLIPATPQLTWLLLTKRPENIARFTPSWWRDAWPDNVWVGATIEDQDAADERIPVMLSVPAPVRFLSCEPLLGSVDLGLFGTVPEDLGLGYVPVGERINWVIAGCESNGARLSDRPTELAWLESLREQCSDAGVPFFLKQKDTNGKLDKVPELDGKIYAEVPR